MNAPNFSLDAEGRAARLPSTTVNGPRSITADLREAGYSNAPNFDQDQSSIDVRGLFFWGIGLALKYRWLILAICAVALAVGFIKTLRATPVYQATVTIQIDLDAPKIVKVDTAPY